jgi:hypothetical protein
MRFLVSGLRQVDSVKHMSWQAQIRGRKRWQLAPPPECLYSCSWISFVVEPGEIRKSLTRESFFFHDSFFCGGSAF